MPASPIPTAGRDFAPKILTAPVECGASINNQETVMAIYRVAIGAGVLVTMLSLTLAGARAHDETKYPDWSGQWKRPDKVGVQWDETKPSGLGQQAPLIPEYRAKLEASLADQRD